MKKPIDVKTAMAKIMAYCSRQEKCKDDVRKKLRAWLVAEDDISEIVKRLEEDKFIDEERYVRAYVNDKYKFAKWGKRKIEYNLNLKHIDRSIISEYLKAVDSDDYMEKLEYILTNKAKSVKAKNNYDMQQKLIRFATSRGYELSDIIKCLKSLDIDVEDVE